MKRLIKILLIVLAFVPFYLKALTLENMYSKNVLVYDLDEDKILYSEGVNEKVGIASLTKIMTVLVSAESISNLDESITITYDMLDNVPWDASTMGLNIGDTVTYRDLLMGAMLPSGADATDSLAVSISGSIDSFVNLMNDKAKSLGLKNTYFYNTTGLDSDYNYTNYSSLEDLLILIRYALNNDIFKEVFTTKSYTTTNGLNLLSTAEKYNKYTNYDLSFVLGSKTGYTDYAGLSLITLSNIDDENIITITANAPVNHDINNHITDLNTIYSSVNNQYNKQLLFGKGDILYELTTKYAKEKSVSVLSKSDIYKFIEGEFDKDKIVVEYDGIKEIMYDTKKDTKLGNISVFYDETLVKNQEVLLENELTFSLIEFIRVNIVYELVGIFVLILLINIFKPKKKKTKKRRKFKPGFR